MGIVLSNPLRKFFPELLRWVLLRWVLLRWGLLLWVLLGMLNPSMLLGQVAQGEAPLVLVQKFQREDLESVCSVRYSPDGKFLYACPWRVATHVVAGVDQQSGELTHVQSMQDPSRLGGATGLNLSADGTLAASGAFRSRTISLYTRDRQTGWLIYRDHKRQGEGGIRGLSFPIDARFSPNGKFVYAVDANNGITIFRVTRAQGQPQLQFVASHTDPELQGMRGLAVHPDGRHLFAACGKANTLAVLRCDPLSGKLTTHQVLQDGQEGLQGLKGCFGVTVSRDGKFAYTVSGRFGGDNAVGVWAFDSKAGKLVQLQSLAKLQKVGQDTKRLVRFQAGNSIAISPDGQHVYATATTSGTLACFHRDLQTGALRLTSMFGDPEAVGGAAGVTVSPDGRYVAVAAETQKTISVFRRRD